MPDDSNWLFAATLPENLRHAARRVIPIVGQQLSKRKFLSQFAHKLKFPSYFGYNWDALEECLSDLSWLPTGETIVLWHRGLPLARRAADRETYLDVLRSAVDKQRGGEHPLVAIFPPSTLYKLESR